MFLYKESFKFSTNQEPVFKAENLKLEQGGNMRYSVNGGFRIEVTGSGFVPEDYTATDPASVPQALIVRNANADDFVECNGMSHHRLDYI